MLSRLNEQELINAREAQRWLTEIGVMFDYLKQKEKLCVILRDDKTSEEDKLKEYKTNQTIYKVVELKKRPDLAKVDVFKKMLDDNVEQFFSLFMKQLKQVDDGEADFDYDTTDSEAASSEDLTMEELIEMARKKLHPEYNEETLKTCMCKIYAPRFEKIAGMIRPMNEVVENLFKVLNTSSIDSLDGIDSLVKESLNMLCVAEHISFNERRMHFTQLLIRYEAFLKKLYFLINHKELVNKDPDKSATLSSAIFGLDSLRNLKYTTNEGLKEFSSRLDVVRQLRNAEAHGGLTVTEEEVDVAIKILIDMYLFATGSCITKLESNAKPINIHSCKRYVLNNGSATEYDEVYGDDVMMAAERLSVKDMDEPTRLEILKKSIIKLINYSYSRRTAIFSKLRHWEAVYRIAVDYGFAIDGDYDYFKKKIDDMELRNLPYALSSNFLSNNNVGIYAKDISEWTGEGLEGRKLAEYEDIKKCADAFEVIVKNMINAYKQK